MKNRRISLTFRILLPTILAVLLVEIAAFSFTYLVLKESDYQDAIETDEETFSLMRTNFLSAERIEEAMKPVKEIYDRDVPVSEFSDGEEEMTYYRKFTGLALVADEKYQTLINALRYVSLGNNVNIMIVGFEDEINHRFVYGAITPSGYFPRDNELVTNLYPGFFSEMGPEFDNDEFYGVVKNVPGRGMRFTSGYCVTYRDTSVEHLKIWVLKEISEDYIYSALSKFTWRFAIVSTAAFVVLIVGIFVLMHILMIRPVRRLSGVGNKYVELLNQGKPEDLFFFDQPRYADEVTDLNNSFFATQEAIKSYALTIQEAAEREQRIKTDLALAERIQLSMVPSGPLEGKNFALHGYMKPAKEVGGDLFNYFIIDQDHVGFFIGDVSGKGVPAALFMAKVAVAFRLLIDKQGMDRVNRLLCEDNVESFFVTAFLGVLNIHTCELKYVNAGHEPVFYCRDGVYEALPEEPNFMLGCLDDIEFVEQAIQLKAGDKLFLYTDGISEAMNPENELFGKERILRVLNECKMLPGKDVIDVMNVAMAKFVNGAEQSDDACMVTLDVGEHADLSIPATQEGLAKVAPFIDEALKDFDETFVSEFQVVIDELVTNVVLYSQSGEKPVELWLYLDKKGLQCLLIDRGVPFDPTINESDRDPETEGGFGIFLSRHMTDELRYERIDDKNILFIKKNVK